jgi:hypothetical protein
MIGEDEEEQEYLEKTEKEWGVDYTKTPTEVAAQIVQELSSPHCYGFPELLLPIQKSIEAAEQRGFLIGVKSVLIQEG